MVDLPPEIWIRIIQLAIPIPRDRRPWRGTESVARFATVSRIWQDVIERSTFSRIVLSDQRLQDALRILSVRYRRSCIRAVELEIELSEEEYHASGSSQSIDEYYKDRFTSCISRFFTIFRALRTSSNGAMQEMALHLHAHAAKRNRRPKTRDQKDALYGCDSGQFLVLDSAFLTSLPMLDMIGEFFVNYPTVNLRLHRIHPGNVLRVGH